MKSETILKVALLCIVINLASISLSLSGIKVSTGSDSGSRPVLSDCSKTLIPVCTEEMKP